MKGERPWRVIAHIWAPDGETFTQAGFDSRLRQPMTVDLGGVPQTGRLVRAEVDPDGRGATIMLELRWTS